MLAYLIIAIELSILYTVFWYVFLREPKPYRIKGNAWGVYEGGMDASLQNFAAGFPQAKAGSDAGGHGDRKRNAIYEEWNAPASQTANTPLTAGELIRSQSRGVERLSSDAINKPGNDQRLQYSQQMQAPAYFPFNPAEQVRSNPKSLPGILTELGDKLNRINVKLP